jgi:hypothetical protein
MLSHRMTSYRLTEGVPVSVLCGAGCRIAKEFISAYARRTADRHDDRQRRRRRRDRRGREKSPEKSSEPLHPLLGLQAFPGELASSLVSKTSWPGSQADVESRQGILNTDSSLAEINPLVITKDGSCWRSMQNLTRRQRPFPAPAHSRDGG